MAPTEREQAIAEAVEALLDLATTQHTENREDAETFTECHMCGGWEEHTADCPVPLLEKWRDAEP